MELLKISEFRNGKIIIAMYHPESTKAYGLTSSKMKELIQFSQSINDEKILTDKIFNDYLNPYFMKYAPEKYHKYLPLSVSLNDMKNDFLLLAVKLENPNCECDRDCLKCEKELEQFCCDETKKYIAEFESKTPVSIPQKMVMASSDNIDNILDACMLMPVKSYPDGCIYKYCQRYYMAFKADNPDKGIIPKEIRIMSEYMDLEKCNRMPFIMEHGTKITDNLADMVKCLKE